MVVTSFRLRVDGLPPCEGDMASTEGVVAIGDDVVSAGKDMVAVTGDGFSAEGDIPGSSRKAPRPLDGFPGCGWLVDSVR